jgi:hypothetical protein
MRTDLQEALNAAPSTMQSGLRAWKNKKLVGELELEIPEDEEIVAVAALTSSTSLMQHGGLQNRGGSALIVTTRAIWLAGGKVVGHAEFVHVPLLSVYGSPRVRVRRDLALYGKQLVELAIDELRGGNVETYQVVIDGGIVAGKWIATEIAREVEETAGEADQHEMRKLREATRSNAPPMSLADELGKLAALRDQGILTDEEFETQKGRLLS